MNFTEKSVIKCFLVVAMIIGCIGLFGCGKSMQKKQLEYWSADSEAAESLRDYVEKITNKNDASNYIPVKDRIGGADVFLDTHTYPPSVF